MHRYFLYFFVSSYKNCLVFLILFFWAVFLVRRFGSVLLTLNLFEIYFLLYIYVMYI